MLIKFRKTVQTMVEGDDIILSNPTFKFSIPLEYVQSKAPILTLIEKREYVLDDSDNSIETNNLIEALTRTGFFSHLENEEYSLRECRQIFDQMISEWYAEYYQHPVWEKARKGELSKSGLLAWLIHNYHISIAAGITDARAAVSMPTAELRSFFRENCMEEYWHCDAFYFVKHPNLNVRDNLVKNYVPLSSSMAFKQQAVRTAEKDWVANVLISYFQESSIRFYNDCLNFYKQVEEKYQIPGMFKTWLQHMSLDFEHSHADVLGELLEKDDIISKQDMLQSFSEAFIAFRFLLCALDEVLIEDTNVDSLYLRNPMHNGTIDMQDNSFILSYSPAKKFRITESAPLKLYSEIQAAGIFQPVQTYSIVNFLETDVQYLRDYITTSFLKAVSYSNSHEQVILFGKLSEKYFRKQGTYMEQFTSAPSLRAVAIGNFLNDISVKPKLFAFILWHISESIDANLQAGDQRNATTWMPVDEQGKMRIRNFLQDIDFYQYEIDEAFNLVIQINEMIEKKDFYERREKSLNAFS
jgi:hypothetical protein